MSYAPLVVLMDCVILRDLRLDALPRHPRLALLGQSRCPQRLAVIEKAFFGYCLLVFAGVLALRVLVLVFRLDAG
jgi:hypothetical protein